MLAVDCSDGSHSCGLSATLVAGSDRACRSDPSRRREGRQDLLTKRGQARDRCVVCANPVPTTRSGCRVRTGDLRGFPRRATRSNPPLRIASSRGTRFHRVPVDQVGVEPTCSSLSERRLDRSASGLCLCFAPARICPSRAPVELRSNSQAPRRGAVVPRGIEPRSPGLQPGACASSARAPWWT